MVNSLSASRLEEEQRFTLHESSLTVTRLTDHPVATVKYYEEQKEAALEAATNFREFRIPKFVGYFERVLKGNKDGVGKYLVGKTLTYADTTLWQVLDG